MTDYLVTLAGPPPEDAAGDAFYRKVAEVSGLPPEQVKRLRGFVTHNVVRHLRAGKLASLYNANYTVDDPNPERTGSHEPDPVLDHVARLTRRNTARAALAQS